MLKISKTLICTAFSLAVLASPGLGVASEFTLRLAGTAAVKDTNPEYMAMVTFKEEVEMNSDGRVEVQLYPANQLGATKEYIEGVSLGTIDMGIAGYDLIGLFDPIAYSLTMPYLHDNLDHYVSVIEGPIGDKIHQHIADTTGMRVLSVLHRGPRNLMTKSTPVRVPADLKGLRIRSPENPLNAGTVTAMGGIPVPMTWGEVYTALSQGVVDGVENPIDVLYNASMYEVQGYLSMTKHIFLGIPLMINNSLYESMPEDLQMVLKNAADKASKERLAGLVASEAKNLEAMKAAGIVVVEDVDLSAFSANAKAVWDEFIDGKIITQDLIDQIKNY